MLAASGGELSLRPLESVDNMLAGGAAREGGLDRIGKVGTR